MWKVRDSTHAGGNFFLLLGRFVFVLKTYFLFLTDLKYTGRLIVSSLTAFISKIINPWVSHRNPLIWRVFCLWFVKYIQPHESNLRSRLNFNSFHSLFSCCAKAELRSTIREAWGEEGRKPRFRTTVYLQYFTNTSRTLSIIIIKRSEKNIVHCSKITKTEPWSGYFKKMNSWIHEACFDRHMSIWT